MSDGVTELELFVDSLVVTCVLALFEPDLEAAQIPDLLALSLEVSNMEGDLILAVEVFHIAINVKGHLEVLVLLVEIRVLVYEQVFLRSLLPQ